jgi:hypothetical protein
MIKYSRRSYLNKHYISEHQDEDIGKNTNILIDENNIESYEKYAEQEKNKKKTIEIDIFKEKEDNSYQNEYNDYEYDDHENINSESFEEFLEGFDFEKESLLELLCDSFQKFIVSKKSCGGFYFVCSKFSI